MPQQLQAMKRKYEPDEEEERLVKRAFTYIDQAIENRTKEVHRDSDRYSLFGQYIACELREVKDPDMERWAKQKIMSILCQAQEGNLLEATI
jgi:hypothetical protein